MSNVTFVNTVEVNGVLNGVVNLAFGTCQFLPETKEGETIVAPAVEITANLRMDLYCAKQLHDALGRILAENTKPQRMDS
jgi:hypothetical protein